MIYKEEFNFGNQVNVVGPTGVIFNNKSINPADMVCFEVSGNFTNARIIPEGLIDIKHGEWTSMKAIDKSTMLFVPEIISKGQYLLPIMGLSYLRFNVLAIDTGSINIYAKVFVS